MEKQDKGEQYLGVVFFGVWSYPNQDVEDHENFKECTETIEVPIREVKNNSMSYVSGNDGKTYYYPRLIWKTGQGQEIREEESRQYRIVPCRGAHTEQKFKKFIADINNKHSLWEYFSNKSTVVKHKDKKLDLVGFKFYSTNDACDICFNELFQMQSNPEEILVDFLPKDIQEKRRIPFQLLFHSHLFYYPQNDYGSESGAIRLVSRGCCQPPLP